MPTTDESHRRLEEEVAAISIGNAGSCGSSDQSAIGAVLARMVYPARKTHLLRQRFDFMDEETRQPMHDEIMLWLDDAVESIVQNTIVGREWDEAEVRNTYPDHYEAYGDAMPPLPPRPPIEVLGKTWAWIVRDKRGEPIGCIDLYVQYTRAELLVDREPSGAPRWFQYNDHSSACFEVRTEIVSVGELVRLVRMYQAHVHGTFYVVSPDDRFRNVLRQQGIGFIKYPAPALDATGRLSTSTA